MNVKYSSRLRVLEQKAYQFMVTGNEPALLGLLERNALLLFQMFKLFQPKFIQVRNAVSNFRPKKLRHKKAFKGTFKPKPLSLRGTTVYFGDYGLQVLEGGRLSDKQLDVCRTAIKRQIKIEKEAKFILKVFPSRPVTRKPAETRMGKGKGAVDYFASWVPKGRVVFEVANCREEVALKALKVLLLIDCWEIFTIEI